jgi:hypothetical protein
MDWSHRVRSSEWQSGKKPVLLAAVLGLIPGCGGAIIVITQFVQGRLSFGAVVAVLTATMGDAAFLLISARPMAALIVFPLSFMSGCIAGLTVDRLHSEGFLRPKPVSETLHGAPVDVAGTVQQMSIDGKLWSILLVPAFVIACLFAGQVDPDAVLGVSAGSSTLVGGVIGLVLLYAWAFGAKNRSNRGKTTCHYCSLQDSRRPIMQRVADDTNFVMSWVVVGFLLIELLPLVCDFSVTHLINGTPEFLVILAIMVGWIPGCGPQILITTMYLNGVIPMSAQLGNAISNDGDALFPALVLAPRAALVGTLYSTIPAIVVAYGYLLVFE